MIIVEKKMDKNLPRINKPQKISLIFTVNVFFNNLRKNMFLLSKKKKKKRLNEL